MSAILEVCIDTYESAKAAVDGGADRLEVCGCLSVGGTTPSYGLVDRCLTDFDIPILMMIRPHAGGFTYGENELATMTADIRMAKSLGVAGVVFAALTESHSVDVVACQRLLGSCEALETTFHRAFDLVNDPLKTLDTIEQLGFTRLLTSGQNQSALLGADLIRQLVDRAVGVKIIAGAGITIDNIDAVVAKSKASEFHASASKQFDDQQSGPQVSFGMNRRITDSEIVRAIKNKIS